MLAIDSDNLYTALDGQESRTGTEGWAVQEPYAATTDVPPDPPPNEPIYDDGPTGLFDNDEYTPTGIVQDDVGTYPEIEAYDRPQSPGDVRLPGWDDLAPASVIPVPTYVAPPPPEPPVEEVYPSPMVIGIDALGRARFGRGWLGTPEQIALLHRPQQQPDVITASITPVEAVISHQPLTLYATPELTRRAELNQNLVAPVKPMGKQNDSRGPLLLLGVAVAIGLAVYLSR